MLAAGEEKARRNDSTLLFHPATGEADKSISQDMRINKAKILNPGFVVKKCALNQSCSYSYPPYTYIIFILPISSS
jgi:hypothetical protein